MGYPVGFRKVKVYPNVAANTLTAIDNEQGYLYVEVTNATSSTVNIQFNDYTLEGHPPTDAIPVAAGTTRNIPIMAFNFKADGVVTVVAFGS